MSANFDGDNVSWTALNENLGYIDSNYHGARLLARGALIFGGFSDPLAKTEVISGNSIYYRGGETINVDFSGWIKNILYKRKKLRDQ